MFLDTLCNIVCWFARGGPQPQANAIWKTLGTPGLNLMVFPWCREDSHISHLLKSEEAQNSKRVSVRPLERNQMTCQTLLSPFE